MSIQIYIAGEKKKNRKGVSKNEKKILNKNDKRVFFVKWKGDKDIEDILPETELNA